MHDLESPGVNIGFTLGDDIGVLIDSVKMGVGAGFTLSDVTVVVSSAGSGVGFTLGDDAEVKFYEVMIMEL